MYQPSHETAVKQLADTALTSTAAESCTLTGNFRLLWQCLVLCCSYDCLNSRLRYLTVALSRLSIEPRLKRQSQAGDAWRLRHKRLLTCVMLGCGLYPRIECVTGTEEYTDLQKSSNSGLVEYLPYLTLRLQRHQILRVLRSSFQTTSTLKRCLSAVYFQLPQSRQGPVMVSPDFTLSISIARRLYAFLSGQPHQE